MKALLSFLTLPHISLITTLVCIVKIEFPNQNGVISKSSNGITVIGIGKDSPEMLWTGDDFHHIKYIWKISSTCFRVLCMYWHKYTRTKDIKCYTVWRIFIVDILISYCLHQTHHLVWSSSYQYSLIWPMTITSPSLIMFL